MSGPNDRIKKKYTLSAIEMLSEMYSIKIMWNFNATSHDKGLVDRIGPTLKRIAADKVRRRENN